MPLVEGVNCNDWAESIRFRLRLVYPKALIFNNLCFHSTGKFTSIVKRVTYPGSPWVLSTVRLRGYMYDQHVVNDLTDRSYSYLLRCAPGRPVGRKGASNIRAIIKYTVLMTIGIQCTAGKSCCTMDGMEVRSTLQKSDCTTVSAYCWIGCRPYQP